MNITYKLNHFLKNEELDKLDASRKLKIEESLGKKFTDYEWIKYKQMVMPKSSRSRK